MNQRALRVLSGLTAITFLIGVAAVGVAAGNGSLTPRYHLFGMFSAAGQGLLPGSDVKIHGVNVGQVSSIHLRAGRARVSMALHRGEHVPDDAVASIRAKTLFGEKFVDIDPGPHESAGPFLRNGQEIRRTIGGFELEKILTDLDPVLRAVNPDELALVLDQLAQGGEGLGPAINRQIAAFRQVADVGAAHAADTQQFLDDLARLSGELANRAQDFLDGTRDLNAALPTLNARGDELSAVLDQAARLSADLSTVLEANRPFLNKVVTEGGKTIQLLFDERANLPGDVRGLREFFQVLAEAATGLVDPTDPASTLAAIELVLGGGPPCGRPPATCVSGAAAPATTARNSVGRPPATASPPRTGSGGSRLPPTVDGVVRILDGLLP